MFFHVNHNAVVQGVIKRKNTQNQSVGQFLYADQIQTSQNEVIPWEDQNDDILMEFKALETKQNKLTKSQSTQFLTKKLQTPYISLYDKYKINMKKQKSSKTIPTIQELSFQNPDVQNSKTQKNKNQNKESIKLKNKFIDFDVLQKLKQKSEQSEELLKNFRKYLKSAHKKAIDNLVNKKRPFLPQDNSNKQDKKIFVLQSSKMNTKKLLTQPNFTEDYKKQEFKQKYLISQIKSSSKQFFFKSNKLNNQGNKSHQINSFFSPKQQNLQTYLSSL